MKIENRSGLIPKGQAVVLLPYEPDLKTTKIAIPDSYREHLRMIENRGVVIAIGPESWRGEAAPRAVIGEKVMFSKHAGAKAIGVDGRSYRVVNADDIFLGIDDGMSLEQIFPEMAEQQQHPFDNMLGFGLARNRPEGEAYYGSKYDNDPPPAEPDYTVSVLGNVQVESDT